MRRCETQPTEPELSTRYYLDEARFAGGKDSLRSQEEKAYG